MRWRLRKSCPLGPPPDSVAVNKQRRTDPSAWSSFQLDSPVFFPQEESFIT
jgi:hypothetical protein